MPAISALGVYNGPNMTAGTAGQQTPNPALIGNTTQAILGLEGTAQQNTYNAQAETIAAQGDTAEANAYGTAGQIAGQESVIAGISGQVQQYQQGLQVQQTVGAQQAAVGAAGFTGAGTALDLMRSSLQQGRLGSQLIGMQTSLQEMGYNEEQAATAAEQTAALSAAAQATTLGADYTTAANTASLNETAATTDLTNYLNSLNPSGSSLTGADKQLLTDLTSGNTAAVQLDINTLVTGPSTSPSAVQLTTGPTGSTGGPFGRFGTQVSPAFYTAANPGGPTNMANPFEQVAQIGGYTGTAA